MDQLVFPAFQCTAEMLYMTQKRRQKKIWRWYTRCYDGTCVIHNTQQAANNMHRSVSNHRTYCRNIRTSLSSRHTRRLMKLI